MFMGEFEHTIDEKGRLSIPAKFRDELNYRNVNTVIVTRGFDDCLFAFPVDEWKLLEEKVLSLPITKSDIRSFVRLLFAGASECPLDGHGRITLPVNLRKYAKISEDPNVVVIGVLNRMEIWNHSEWISYMTRSEEKFEETAEELELIDTGRGMP